MKIAWTTVPAFVAGFGIASVVSAAINTSSFSANDEGWAGIQTDTQMASGGAVDNGGYLAIDRGTSSPIADATAGTNGGVFVGNLQTTYGEGGNADGLTISLYYQDFSTGTQAAVPRYLALQFSSGANDNFLINPGVYPTLPDPIVRNEWRQMSLDIEFDWTDGQASAAGWNHTGSGSLTWAQVMENVTRFRILTWEELTTNGANQTLGLDEITFASVPEPSSLAWLGLSALAALRRRR